MKKHIVVLTSAGISAESGIRTFRDADGLWEGHDVMEVASPQGFRNNPELVLDFYNQRRRQLKEVTPNAAHIALVELEKEYKVSIVTQNVDDLHERAGSTNVLHLHGELRKIRSTGNPQDIRNWEEDINLGDKCTNGYQLRPHIVWFGEAVPAIEQAVDELFDADYVIIVGTSMQVYPAASLVGYAPKNAKIYYVDPNPSINAELDRSSNLEIIAKPATIGMQKVVEDLMG